MAIIESLNQLSSQFTLAEALTLARPIILFIIGMGIYSWFIFKYYRFVARREIFKWKLGAGETGKKSFLGAVGYILKHLIIFPILTFFWFIILAAILIFLSKNNSVQSVLLVSVSLIGVIRLMAYYNEDLSKDLAKMLPFALLGVFLVDVSFFSVQSSIESLTILPSLWKNIMYYLFFIILLEFILRISYGIIQLFKDTKK
jgi:hypothetical protein